MQFGRRSFDTAPVSPVKRGSFGRCGCPSNTQASSVAFAQGAGTRTRNAARLLSQGRILIKGGVVLTLDRQIGDFAQADVLIEDGKIREVRPGIAVSATP